jgi:hypothetical protein
MKKSQRKLSLDRETLRLLEQSDLNAALGGITLNGTCNSACPTRLDCSRPRTCSVTSC